MVRPLAILIRRLLWISIGVALVVFAVNNRTITEISLSPLPFSLSLPLWALLFAGIFIGLIIAATVTGWIRLQGFTQRRKAERRANYLDKQMTALAEDAYQGRATKAHNTASDSKPSTALANDS